LKGKVFRSKKIIVFQIENYVRIDQFVNSGKKGNTTMEQKAEIFEKIYQGYLSQIAALDMDAIGRDLRLHTKEDAVIIPFYGKQYSVSPKGVFNVEGKRPNDLFHHSVCVILCKFLILYPNVHPDEGDWVSYKDFKDAAPFVGGFYNTVERPIAEYFSGKSAELDRACRQLGGRVPDISLSYELSMQFDALPRIPVLLLFNDVDEDFPSVCKVLFKQNAPNYLDSECIAMVGMLLSSLLKNRKDGGIG
jgi:hypothetical protein